MTQKVQPEGKSSESSLVPGDLEGQISVVILAGGRSRRMQEQDKGLVKLAGRPLVEHVIEAIRPQNSNILINANQHLSAYREFGLPVFSDELQGFQGPLAGVASAMRQATTPYLLTLPCDAPFVLPDYQQRMWTELQQQQVDLVVAHDGRRLQPVHALLPVRLEHELLGFLAGKTRRVDAWYSGYAMGLADFSDATHMFHNLNTLEQLEAYSLQQKRIL